MSTDELAMRTRIREFILANLNAIDDDIQLKDDDNIFALGYVNSIFAMRLLATVENLSGAQVADEDILLANFSSVDAMIALIDKCQVRA